MNSFKHLMDLSIRFAKTQYDPYMAMFLDRQYQVLCSIWEGAPYLGATYYIPGELMALFDVETLYIERAAGFGAANRLIPNLDAKRAKYALPAHGCSYQLCFQALIEEGFIPAPNGFVGSNFACDDAWLYSMSAAARFKIPYYFLDVVPYGRVQTIPHMGAQLEQLYHTLSLKYNRRQSLEETVEWSNRALDMKEKIDALRLAHPGIMSGTDSFKIFTLYNDLGKESTLNILTAVYESLLAKVPDHKPVREYKILWLGIIPLYLNRLIQDIENRYHCRIIEEELFHYPSRRISAGAFFDGLAARISSSLYFSLRNRLRTLFGLIRKHEIDGVICFSQRNCRFLSPVVPVIQQAFGKHGIPLVEIQGDAIIPEHFNESQCWERLDVFFEMMRGRCKQCM